MNCPRCQAQQKQYRAGFNPSGSQRYRCGVCNRVYTPQPTPKGYPADTHMLALRLYMEGNSQRAIGRILKVSQQSVANWINAYVDKLPSAPVPEKPQEAELDELYTFLQKKKRSLHPDDSGSSHTVCFELGCDLRANQRKYASLPGTGAASETVLQ